MSLPEQVEKGASLTENIEVPDIVPKNIIIGGMGGSAIGGDILASLLFRRSPMPIYVNRNYSLPSFAREDTLLFIVSYSGNTPETISMFREGMSTGCRIIAITSGGMLKRECKKHGAECVCIPKGLMPRAAIGYLFSPILTILNKMKIYDPEVEIHNTVHVTKEFREKIRPEVPTDKNPAKSLAMSIKNKVPVIYGHTVYGAVARRWHTQLNENAKTISLWGTIPEIAHNEIVAWGEDSKAEDFVILLLRDNAESEEVSMNVEATKRILKRNVEVLEVKTEADTYLARIMSAIFLGDALSVYLAFLKGVDPAPVKRIDQFKEILMEYKRHP